MKKAPAIAVGTRLPPLAKRVSAAHVDLSYRRLLMVAGDLDSRFTEYVRGANIHTSDEAARAAGFAGRVAPGFHGYAFVSEMLGRYFGAGWSAGGKMGLKFLRPFYLDEEITCEAEVTETVLGENSGEGYAELAVRCRNSRGDVVVAGTARARIRQRA